jgi:hypothetical protein
MPTAYEFELVLRTDYDEDNFLDEIADRLIEAGCDDAVFSVEYGSPRAAFERKSPSFVNAVLSALADVESVAGVRVERIEREELLSVSAIAQRIGRSRQNVQQWVDGQRGPGHFPAQATWVTGARVYPWVDVRRWLIDSGLVDSAPEGETDELIAALNGALAAHHHAQHLTDRAEKQALHAFLGRDLITSRHEIVM